MKKNKLFGKVLCVALAGAMVFSLTSCKKGGTTTSAGNTSGLVAQAADVSASKEAVFRFDTKIDLPIDPSSILVNGDQILYFVQYYEPDYYPEDMEPEIPENDMESDSEIENAEEADNTDETVDTDGETTDTDGEVVEDDVIESSEEEIPFDAGQNINYYHCAWVIGDKSGNVGDLTVYEGTYSGDKSVSIESYAFTSDGNITLIVSEFDFEKSANTYYAIKVSTDGKELARQELNIPKTANVEAVRMAEDGTICICADHKIQILDANLKMTSEVSADRINSFLNFISTGSGKYYVSYFTADYDVELCEILLTERRLGNGITFPGLTPSGFRSCTGHDFCARNESGISVIDIKNDTPEIKMIFSYIDSDISGYSVNLSAILDDETVILFMDSTSGDTGIYKRVPPEEVKDKKIITLGSIYSVPYDIQKRVLEYNKQSDTYKIRLVNYEQYYDPEDNFAAEKQFRNDILSKAGPDIIMTSNMLNPGIYASKGVFADMYPYFEQNGINKEDYLQNILDAGSYDGSLYILMPQFSIEYVAVKESILGGREGFSMKEFMDLEEQYNCKGSGFYSQDRDTLLTAALVFTANSYYDTTTGECDFESEDFINTLKWLKEYPEKVEEEDSYMQSFANQEMALHKNEALAQLLYLYNLRDFNETEQVNFGDNVALVGFPGADNPGSGVIMADMGFAISALGDNQEAAFDFIKYYLSEEYQMPAEDVSQTWSFPILKTALDKKIEIETAEPFEYDEKTKKKTPYKERAYSYAKGEDIEVQPLSADHAQKVKKFISSSTYFTNYDQKIIDIIKEEAAPFFNNQKSAEDVAKIIQSRVSIYVRENQ